MVTASGPTADGAAQRADAVVSAYQAYVTEQVSAAAQAAIVATQDATVIDQDRCAGRTILPGRALAAFRDSEDAYLRRSQIHSRQCRGRLDQGEVGQPLG